MTGLFLKIEELSVSDALLTSLVCFVIIIAVLIALIGVILLMRMCVNKLVGSLDNAKTKKMAQNQQQVTATSTPQEAKGSSGGINIFNVEPKDAAMLMAIVADEMETPLNHLRFKSIKLIDEVGDKK